MTNECESVSIKYQGNGVQKLFTFPFTYMAWKDVQVFLYDETNKTWVNQENKFIQANATTIEFFTPPPAPTDSEIDNVWIARRTDLEAMLVTFYPGSSIRAQDLNDDFDQLRLAIQEGRCALQDGLDGINENTWHPDETFTEDDQVNQRWIPADDEKLATSDAIRARHDSYVQPNVPPTVVYQQTGKTWQNTDDCWSSYWQNSVDDQGNDSKTWVAYVNTGPRGEQGPQGPPGQSIVGPPGPEGPAGPNGGSFPDAPADGTLYGRKDNDWEEVATVAQATYTFVAPLKEVNHVVSLDLLTIPNAP